MADATDPPKLTLQDQAVLNLLAFLSVQVMRDDRTEVALQSLARVLASGARPKHPQAIRLHRAATDLVAAREMRGRLAGGRDWAGAMFEVQGVLSDALFWRAGLALDALFPAEAITGEDAA
jgi:hypothetical protein